MKKSESRSRISNEKTGFLAVLSAPSGCGKTTILARLLKRHPDWVRSVSVTTRPPRPEEKNRRDYEFVTPRAFQSLKTKREFLESARIFGQYYGTPRKVVEDSVKAGRTVLLAIDIQGARSVRRLAAKKVPCFSIFVLPPSVSALRERLEKRHTDSAEEIEKRIERAEEEIKAAREYDATVINRNLDQTAREIEALISEFAKQLKGEKRNVLHPARKTHA